VLGYFGFGSFEWLKIHDSMNIHDFENHLKYFPIGPFASGANVKLLGAKEWPWIKSSKKSDDLQDFIQKYPGSMYVALARLRLERLQSIAAGKYRPLIAGSSTRPLEPKDLLALGCDELWTARNEIFYAVGYCFVTNTAITAFGTAIDCPYQKCRTVQAIDTMIDDEILTEIERRNINFIKEKERADHCQIPQAGDACAQAR
jgi:YARHG domain